MPQILLVVLTIIILFLVAWFCYWLINQVEWPTAPPGLPLKFIFQIIVLVAFLFLVFGLFGAFGTSWHPYLFSR